MTPEERDWAIRTLYGEAATDPASQAAVAHVIKNRAAKSGASVQDVVTSPYQFEPWQSRAGELKALDKNSEIYKGLGQVIDAAWAPEAKDPTGGATLFYAPAAQKAKGRAAPDWDTGGGQTIGQHVFFKGNFPTPKGSAIVIKGLGPQPSSTAPAVETGAAPVTPGAAPRPKTKSGSIADVPALFQQSNGDMKALALALEKAGLPPVHIAMVTGLSPKEY